MSYLAAGLAGYQIISGIQQAEMVRMQAGIQKQIDEFNAQQAEYDAWKMVGYGQTQMARYQSSVDQAQAAARVSAAAEGVELSGSLGELYDQNQIAANATRLEIENRARERALGYTRQAQDIRLGSTLRQGTTETQAASIIGGSVLKAAATGVSTLASGGKTPLGTSGESGYSLDLPIVQSEPGSYLTGTSQDLAGTGYLMMP